MRAYYEQSETSPHSNEPVLYGLAEMILDDARVARHYNDFKWHYVGHPETVRRQQHEYPNITRDELVYSRSVFSGVNPESATLLQVSQDPYHPMESRGWFVAETDLITGYTAERSVLVAEIDAQRKLWMQLASSVDYYGRARQSAHYRRLMEHTHLSMPVDERFHAESLEYRASRFGAELVYEDVEALESMIQMVRAVREVYHRDQEAELYRLARQFALGDKASKHAFYHIAA